MSPVLQSDKEMAESKKLDQKAMLSIETPSGKSRGARMPSPVSPLKPTSPGALTHEDALSSLLGSLEKEERRSPRRPMALLTTNAKINPRKASLELLDQRPSSTMLPSPPKDRHMERFRAKREVRSQERPRRTPELDVIMEYGQRSADIETDATESWKRGLAQSNPVNDWSQIIHAPIEQESSSPRHVEGKKISNEDQTSRQLKKISREGRDQSPATNHVAKKKNSNDKQSPRQVKKIPRMGKDENPPCTKRGEEKEKSKKQQPQNESSRRFDEKKVAENTSDVLKRITSPSLFQVPQKSGRERQIQGKVPKSKMMDSEEDEFSDLSRAISSLGSAEDLNVPALEMYNPIEPYTDNAIEIRIRLHDEVYAVKIASSSSYSTLRESLRQSLEKYLSDNDYLEKYTLQQVDGVKIVSDDSWRGAVAETGSLLFCELVKEDFDFGLPEISPTSDLSDLLIF